MAGPPQTKPPPPRKARDRKKDPADAAGQEPLPPGRLTGKVVGDTYLIQEVIGRGGMGTVYRAQHVRTGHPFAVKSLNRVASRYPRALDRFRQEAQILIRLRHPNIAALHDFFEDVEGVPLIVMEYLSGQDLDTVVTGSGPLALPRAVSVAYQVGRALRETHRQGVIHRDLKPENIYLCPDPHSGETVKVLDFGLAKELSFARSLTGSGFFVGTPGFNSPEQAREDARIDHRSDIFCLGLILYYMLSGERPFAGDPVDVLNRIASQDPPPLSGLRPRISAGLVAVVEKAIRKHPDERFQTVQEMLTALRGLRGHLETRPLLSPRLWAAALGAVLALLAATALIWLIR
jgi:serine/threonine-protein kinase